MPEPAPRELLLKIECCAICRTDLHVIEGKLPTQKLPVIPGHQAVGKIESLGSHCSRLKIGERVGVAWLHRSCGRCLFCRKNQENLCESPQFSGYHT